LGHCRRNKLLVGGLYLPHGLRGSTELHRGGKSGLSKPTQAGLATIGAFNYFAGDDPSSPVFLPVSRKKQARTIKGHFHIGDSSAIEGISDHVILPCHLFYFGGLRPGDFTRSCRCTAILSGGASASIRRVVFPAVTYVPAPRTWLRLQQADLQMSVVLNGFAS
jgi:hypothetical protein